MWLENPFKCNILFCPPCYTCWGPESQNMQIYCMGSSWLAVKGNLSALNHHHALLHVLTMFLNMPQYAKYSAIIPHQQPLRGDVNQVKRGQGWRTDCVTVGHHPDDYSLVICIQCAVFYIVISAISLDLIQHIGAWLEDQIMY